MYLQLVKQWAIAETAIIAFFKDLYEKVDILMII